MIYLSTSMYVTGAKNVDLIRLKLANYLYLLVTFSLIFDWLTQTYFQFKNDLMDYVIFSILNYFFKQSVSAKTFQMFLNF